MLELHNISKTFRKRGALGRILSETLAVNDVSLALTPGKTVGVVGESGSGKSTLARIALRMINPDAGQIIFNGSDITTRHGRALDPFRHQVQPVFQDSAGALDPRMTVRKILSEPLILRGAVPSEEFDDRISAALTSVDLPNDMRTRRPMELSGGQRQRIGIARALLMEPSYLILDEPVSALDVSVQAQVLNLLKDLQDEKGLSYLFIGHDLSVARFFCDDILVMYLGNVEEHGPGEELFEAPQSDYTRKLLKAMPREL